jgi:hypothetical protein
MDRIFFVYMAVVGSVVGALLVAFPRSGDGWFKPYLWVLIMSALFEGVGFALRRGQPGSALSGGARLLGFAIGIAVMVAIPKLAGSSARLF